MNRVMIKSEYMYIVCIRYLPGSRWKCDFERDNFVDDYYPDFQLNLLRCSISHYNENPSVYIVCIAYVCRLRVCNYSNRILIWYFHLSFTSFRLTFSHFVTKDNLSIIYCSLGQSEQLKIHHCDTLIWFELNVFRDIFNYSWILISTFYEITLIKLEKETFLFHFNKNQLKMSQTI